MNLQFEPYGDKAVFEAFYKPDFLISDFIS
jgi:hypothetical protein